MTGAPATLAAALEAGATVEVLGRIRWSSNATLLVEITTPGDADTRRAVYKPGEGERPLYDFPPGIWRREIAAYELAKALDWDCIPETVPFDGPFGQGSLQRFVEVDYDDHYFTMIAEEDPLLDAQLQRLAVFDLIANNTDRKGGHCLLDADRHVWGIDNALCFHAEFKLRTVIWDFAGLAIPPELLEDVETLVDTGLPETLIRWLEPDEADAVCTRARALLHERVFPHDPTGRRYPWPLV